MNTNTFITKRLIIRNWQESDVLDIHRCLSNKAIALSAGLQPMETLENSRQYLKTLINETTRFAISVRNNPQVIGYIGLRSPDMDFDYATPGELEIGFWLDVPFWGKGYIPEAIKALEKFAFEELNCSAIWAAYFQGNEQCRHCLEKCGYTFHHTEENRYMIKLNDRRTEHFTRLSKEQWLHLI